MKRTTYCIMAAALLTAGALLTTACSGEEEVVIDDTTPKTVTFTATLAPKGDDGGQTRAITTGKDANNKEVLNVAWAEGEKISIRYQKSDDSWDKVEATVGTPNADGSAPITATLTNAKEGATATLIYPYSLANTDGDGIDEDKLLTNQRGILTHSGSGTDYSISKRFDAATASAPITVSGTTASVNGTVTMENQCCICKFSFYTSDGQTITMIPQLEKVTITIDDKTYEVAPSGFKSNHYFYLAMLPVTNATAVIRAFDGGISLVGGPVTYSQVYSNKLDNVTLEAGKFYRSVSVELFNGDIIKQTVVIPDGMTYTLSNQAINITSGPAIQCEGNATIIIEGTNTVTTSAEGQPAIFIPEGNTLTISGTGSLTAESTGEGAAGIGGGWEGGYSTQGIPCGNIVIESGTVTATGKAAGIGGGAHGTCGDITINGGTVTATGQVAGIGGGSYGSCGDITINGGTVTATGQAAGIGGGAYGSCGDITITSPAKVTATGGNLAAGIGCSYNDTCGNITISGGTVTATGGDGAAGIGSGCKGKYESITIGGGNVTATGGEAAAGIGSGTQATCGTITISGGTVTATGGRSAAGIGGGYKGKYVSITIGGGITSVTATAGYEAQAPIGKGEDDSGSGSVTVDGVPDWAGIWTTHLNFAASTLKDAQDRDITRWTLTHK